MLDDVKRYDMKKPVVKQRLRPLMWLLSLPETYSHKLKISKFNMEGIKPPYLLLANHNAFLDMKNLIRAVLPHRCSYVVAIDGFIGREGLLRAIGGICTRKFVFDTDLFFQMKTSIEQGSIAVMYPEARYSLCGTKAIIPTSVGRLAKMLGVPVVTFICHGDHINSPFWNTRNRKIKGIEAELRRIVDGEEIKTIEPEEIFSRLEETLQYDEYAWQKEKGVRVKVPWRAEGLHKVLYQCPHCLKEYQMDSKGDLLFCKHCGKQYRMSELGELVAVEGVTEFSHIPDWYEWERSNVRREIETGVYHFESICHVDALPNAKGYIPIGKATLTQTLDGFRLRGEYDGREYEYTWSSKTLYSCHIEYEYLGKKGDCVDLNLPNDTFYIYPECEEFSVTKLSLATEEIHKYVLEKQVEES